MNPIGLTGDPVAMDAAGTQLAMVATQRGLELRLFVGLKTSLEAYAVRQSNGEIWHCGPYQHEPALVGQIDRVLPGRNAVEIEPQVVASVDEMLAKTHINGELHG